MSATLPQLAAGAVAFVLASAPPTPTPIAGYAYDRATGAPLYSEHHYQTFDGDRLVSHRVEYREPAGALICEKALRYDDRPFAPSFQLTDHRDGYREGAEHRGTVYRMFRFSSQNEETDDVPATADLVADAGFDRFVRARLDALQHAPQRIRLAIPGRLATLDFKIRTVAVNHHTVELRVAPDSLLRFIVAPIALFYDARTGRLVRYVGTSNIRGPSGDRYDTRIEFPAGGARPADFVRP